MGVKRGYVALFKPKYRNLKIGTGQYIVRIINNHQINLAWSLETEAKHFEHESSTFDSYEEAKDFIDDMTQYGKGKRYDYVILRIDAYAEATNEVLNKSKCKKKRYAILYEFLPEPWDKRVNHHIALEKKVWRAVYLGTVEGYDMKDIERYVDRYNAHIHIYPLKNGKIVPKQGHKIPPISSLDEFRQSRADWEYDKDDIIKWQNNLKLSGSYELIPFEWFINKDAEQEKIIKDRKIKEVKDEVLKVMKNGNC